MQKSKDHIELDIRVTNSGNGFAVVRANPDDDYIIFGWRGGLQFALFAGGSPSHSGSRSSVTSTITAEDEPIRIGLRVQGDTLTPYINGVKDEPYVIPAAFRNRLLSGTKHGFGSRYHSSRPQERLGDVIIRKLP